MGEQGCRPRQGWKQAGVSPSLFYILRRQQYGIVLNNQGPSIHYTSFEGSSTSTSMLTWGSGQARETLSVTADRGLWAWFGLSGIERNCSRFVGSLYCCFILKHRDFIRRAVHRPVQDFSSGGAEIGFQGVWRKTLW